MVWFFVRDGEQLRYEIRRTGDDSGYELELVFPDGRTNVEELRDAAELLDRCATLAQGLKAEGWRAS